MKKQSRREFLVKGAVAIAAAGTAHSLLANTLPNINVKGEEPVIDIHQHTHYMSRTDEELITHQRSMGVTTTILQPSGHPVEYGSTYYGVANGLQAEATGNEDCYQLSLKYPDEFLFGANEVPDLPTAHSEIEKYLKLGAKVIGECKFGVECDSPEMQRIYQMAREFDVPVLMHWQSNMYNRGFERFHKMLKKYHRVNFIGHAPTWWANIDKDNVDQNILYPTTKVTPGGLTDKLLSDYSNIYGDFSAGSGLNALERDEDQVPEFLKRHQDKLLFGSDCSDVRGSGKKCAGMLTLAALRKLSPTHEIERKILYENAKKLFKL